MRSDSRFDQMRALAKDVRQEAEGLADECPVHGLAKVVIYANWILSALDEAEQELTDRAAM